MPEVNGVLAIYSTHSGAEEAVKELQRARIDMRTLSIVARDSHSDQQVVGYYNRGDRMKYWGKMGAFWGGCWGLLFGAGFFVIPGIGPVLVAGPLVSWIAGALEGAVVLGGLSVFGAGLYGMGIPRNSVIKYEMAVKANRFLLMVNGSAEDVEAARDIIAGTWPINVTLHSSEVAAASVPQRAAECHKSRAN